MTTGTKTNITRAQLIRAIQNYERLVWQTSHVPLGMVTLMNGKNMRATITHPGVSEVYDPVLSTSTVHGRGVGGLLRTRRRKRVMVQMHRICLFYRLRGDISDRSGFMTVLARDWDSWG